MTDQTNVVPQGYVNTVNFGLNKDANIKSYDFVDCVGVLIEGKDQNGNKVITLAYIPTYCNILETLLKDTTDQMFEDFKSKGGIVDQSIKITVFGGYTKEAIIKDNPNKGLNLVNVEQSSFFGRGHIERHIKKYLVDKNIPQNRIYMPSFLATMKNETIGPNKQFSNEFSQFTQCPEKFKNNPRLFFFNQNNNPKQVSSIISVVATEKGTGFSETFVVGDNFIKSFQDHEWLTFITHEKSLTQQDRSQLLSLFNKPSNDLMTKWNQEYISKIEYANTLQAKIRENKTPNILTQDEIAPLKLQKVNNLHQNQGVSYIFNKEELDNKYSQYAENLILGRDQQDNKQEKQEHTSFSKDLDKIPDKYCRIF